jgi:hypothetical protein
LGKTIKYGNGATQQKAPPETHKSGMMISLVLTVFNYSSFGDIKGG